MNNRKKIMDFCSKHNLEVKRLEFQGNREYIYGDSVDSSCWELTLIIDGEDEEFTSDKGDTIAEGIDQMFEEIDVYMNTGRVLLTEMKQ